jgi:hypothetical protein
LQWAKPKIADNSSFDAVFLGQAMTRFSLDGRTALGLSEYFDAASACPSLISASQRAVAVDE